MKKFVIVIDTQYDFVAADGKLPVAGAEAIIAPGIRYLANLNPDEIEGVLFTYDTHVPEIYNGSLESEQFPIHCVKGTPGWENVFNPKLVSPNIPVWKLEKGVFNMWEEPSLRVLRGIIEPGSGFDRDMFFGDLLGHCHLEEIVDTVQVIGVASDFCVKWAVDGLLKRGFKVEIIEELTAGIINQTREVAAAEWKDQPVSII